MNAMENKKQKLIDKGAKHSNSSNKEKFVDLSQNQEIPIAHSVKTSAHHDSSHSKNKLKNLFDKSISTVASLIHPSHEHHHHHHHSVSNTSPKQMQLSGSMSTLSDESALFVPDNHVSKLKNTLPSNLSHEDDDSTSQSSNETVTNPLSTRKVEQHNQLNKSFSNRAAYSAGSSYGAVNSKQTHNSDAISAYTDEADDEQDDASSILTNNQSILYDSLSKKQSKLKHKSFKTRDDQLEVADRHQHAQNNRIISSKHLLNSDYDGDDFLDAFRVFDLNGDGRITAKELNYVLKELGIKMKKKDIEKMINELDKDKNGTIEYSEFVQMMTMPASREADEFELREAFRCIDTDGNGYISREELKQAVEKIMSMDKKISMQDVEEMMREADVDGNGLIDFDEFVRILVDKRN